MNLFFSQEPGEELQHALVRQLAGAGKTLAVAESCTGGQLAHLITNVPGSSAVFFGGNGNLRQLPENRGFWVCPRQCSTNMVRSANP